MCVCVCVCVCVCMCVRARARAHVRVCQGIREIEICSGLRERFYYREREREKVLYGEKFTIKLNSVHLIVFL